MTSRAENGGRKVVLRVEGMTCGGCVNGVTRALQDVQGATQVEVSLQDERAQLQFLGDDAQILVDAVREHAGKKATIVRDGASEIVLRVDGMSCGGCVGGVTRALQSVKGVSDVQVLLEEGRATLAFDGDDVNALVLAVREHAGKVATVV